MNSNNFSNWFERDIERNAVLSLVIGGKTNEQGAITADLECICSVLLCIMSLPSSLTIHLSTF